MQLMEEELGKKRQPLKQNTTKLTSKLDRVYEKTGEHT
jgi:hypothetical protein